MYYRIPHRDISIYEKLGKKLLPIGEEAVVNMETWTPEGSHKKDLRNAVNRLGKQGYTFRVNTPPQTDAYLQQLRAVSNEWLKELDRQELVFSQGRFSEKELKPQTILSLETAEGKVVGFVNLIPDYAPGETNFDLMRKTADAPNGAMDFLFMKMMGYIQEAGFKYCCMGIVPMSGIDKAENVQEQVIKLAYERIAKFGHYKSLRSFKEKFDPNWEMMYVAYEAPFDLIYFPGALEEVIENREE
jgi:phosphatidylglycerol lysyltransferase